MNKNILMGLSLILFSMVSCRPVLAIGWGEFLFLAVVIVMLIVPPVYRFIRRFERSKNQKDK